MEMITLLPLLISLSAAAADFDQEKFEGSGPPLIPRTTAEAVVLPGKSAAGLEIATSYGRLGNYLLNHSGHAEMANLLVDPRMADLSVELQARLRAQGAGLTSDRDSLLPGANDLDNEDAALVARRQQLEESKRSLDARLAEINRQAAEHNAQCLPTHPPERHAWCVENARRLNGIIAQYNEDVKVHNDKNEQWKKDVAALQPRWDAFVAKIRDWEKRVSELIDTIKAAFGQLRDCEYQGGKSEIIRLDPIESKITCKYNCCGNYAEHYHFIKGKPTQPEIDFICTNPLPRCVVNPALKKR